MRTPWALGAMNFERAHAARSLFMWILGRVGGWVLWPVNQLLLQFNPCCACSIVGPI
eukprot:gene12693-19615_t